MSEYGITDSGVNIKRFDTILAEINADQSEGLGVQVGSNTRSFLNVLNTSMADKIAELWELGAEIYHSLSPDVGGGGGPGQRCPVWGHEPGVPQEHLLSHSL